MKKTILSIIFLSLAFSLSAKEYDLPEFEENENAIIFDARELRDEYDDYVKFLNFTDYCNISFELYGMRGNRKSWHYIGSVVLDGLFDEMYIDSKYNYEYDMFRYFAVVPQDDDPYAIDMFSEERSYVLFSNDTLIFTVNYDGEEPDTRYKENASIVELKTVRGRFEDNIKLVNRSYDRRIDIIVYGFNEEDAEVWDPIGYAYLRDANDEDFLETPLKSRNGSRKYNYYAVVAMNGEKYDIDCFIRHDDLYIEIY